MFNIDKSWEEFVRILQPRDFLSPENEYKFKVIPEGLFKFLQRKAKLLLQAHPDAPEAVKQHWLAMVEGIPPYGMIIEKKTRKGKEYVQNNCKTSD